MLSEKPAGETHFLCFYCFFFLGNSNNKNSWISVRQWIQKKRCGRAPTFRHHERQFRLPRRTGSFVSMRPTCCQSEQMLKENQITEAQLFQVWSSSACAHVKIWLYIQRTRRLSAAMIVQWSQVWQHAAFTSHGAETGSCLCVCEMWYLALCVLSIVCVCVCEQRKLIYNRGRWEGHKVAVETIVTETLNMNWELHESYCWDFF